MNSDLATHISILAAPIYSALIARAEPPVSIKDDEWHGIARIVAIGLARQLWEATLAT